MFIYQGKFNWPEFADNETFTVIFPNGVVRANDPVYVFTQWTKDSSRVLKSKFFQTIVVSDVKQLSKTTDISFNLSGPRYSYAVTTEQNYAKIKVDMSGPGGQKTIALDRVWKPEGKVDHDAALQIWAGSIVLEDTAQGTAKDEQAIFVLPEDNKDGKPIISSWQWTKDSTGKAKTTVFKGTPLKFISSDDKVSKFAFNNVHDFTCSLNLKTNQLGLEIKKNGKLTRAGQLSLFAKIEPKAHSFDSDDLVPPTKKEVEFRLPQPQATLPRMRDPMPFPKTLLDTLKHGAAFIEQAGYLTVQAQNKFNALDVDYHKQIVLVETLKKDKKNLETEITSLEGQRDKANATIDRLNKQLDNASKEYKEKVKLLNDRIEHLKQDDRFDHAVINKLQEDLNKVYDEIACLNKDLNKAQRENERLNQTIATLQKEVFVLIGKVIELENELKVQKDANTDLSNKNVDLENKLRESLLANKALQSQLATAEDNYERTKTERDAAINDFNSTKKLLDDATTDLKAKTATLEKTQGELTETQSKLAETGRKLEAAELQVANRDEEAETFEERLEKADEKYQALATTQRGINRAWSKLVNEYQDKCFKGEISKEQLKDLNTRVEQHRKSLN